MKTKITPETCVSTFYKNINKKTYRRELEAFLNNKNKDWDECLFVPLQYIYYAILKSIISKDLFKYSRFFVDSCVWEYSKSRYIFDKDLFDLIVDSSSDKVPESMLYNLKDWAMMIDYKNTPLYFDNKKITHSMLTVINYFCVDSATQNIEADNNQLSLYLVCYYQDEFQKYDKIYMAFPLSKDKKEYIKIKNKDEGLARKILNLYLFILCENSKIENKNNIKVKFNSTKSSKRVFIPKDIKTWNVKLHEKYQIDKDILKSSSTFVRPHVRRGHFHSYWIGPKQNPNDLVIKWIPPIYVNAHRINS